MSIIMRGFLFFSTLVLCASQSVFAQNLTDSTAVEVLNEAVVSGIRIKENAPFAVVNIDRNSLQDFSSSLKELPFLVATTPGVLSWSENGVGMGTSFMRIRGAGDSRINVTIDDVPLNSPEDQCVFWANMNSYSKFLESIQIQRGVGSSTNGDGAFGGSIALRTKTPSLLPYTEVSASYGSFNSYNTGVQFSTGLLDNRFVADAAINTSGTDGYVHGTSGYAGSWYAGFTFLGRDLSIRCRNIGNYEHTGQAWNGVVAGNDDLSIMDGSFGSATGIKTYADMYREGLGRYNSLYEGIDPEMMRISERYKLNDVRFWPKCTDNFTQDHNILSLSWIMNDCLKSSFSLRYTYGFGYYDEFRPLNKLYKFGFSDVTDGSGTVIKKSDFVRQKGLRQNTFGAVYNIGYKKELMDFVAGVSAQYYGGKHFGYLTYIGDKEVASAYGLQELNDSDLKNGRHTYYDSDASKGDYSAYAKLSYTFARNFTAFADLQFRYVNYSTSGINDRFIAQEDGTVLTDNIDIDEDYFFFNPKLGFDYSIGDSRVYASFAMANREPERNNFTDNGAYPSPVAEHLNDYELGYQFLTQKIQFGANIYYMDYVNQFVQTGAVSNVGEKLTTNIKDSYRAGVELNLSSELCSWFRLEANAALSVNRILDFDEIVEDWERSSQTIHYGNSTMAYSPAAIVNGFATIHTKGFEARWSSSFVSRQFLDNTECMERSLPAYSLSSLNLGYKLKLDGFLKEIDFALNVNNVFNAHVAVSGWVYSAISEANGHGNDNRYYQIGFIPTAGTTAIGTVILKF